MQLNINFGNRELIEKSTKEIGNTSNIYTYIHYESKIKFAILDSYQIIYWEVKRNLEVLPMEMTLGTLIRLTCMKLDSAIQTLSDQENLNTNTVTFLFN